MVLDSLYLYQSYGFDGRRIHKTGAGRENRTPISSLENSHTNRCTIPAEVTSFIIAYFCHLSPSAIIRLVPAPVAQWIRAMGFYPTGRGFESLPGYHAKLNQ